MNYEKQYVKFMMGLMLSVSLIAGGTLVYMHLIQQRQQQKVQQKQEAMSEEETTEATPEEETTESSTEA